MSDRLADVSRRIATVRQLGGVVNAMRGIAAARAQQARTVLPAVRTYAETAARAIGQARALRPTPTAPQALRTLRPGLVVFGAEQGFAGAFAELVVDAVQDAFADSHVFLVGSRASTLATERGQDLAWTGPLPNRASALPGLATRILDAVYAYLVDAGATPIDLVYPVWRTGGGPHLVRRTLLPFDENAHPPQPSALPPLVNLAPGELIARLGEEYVFAQLCEAAIEAFAAENEARMTTMAAAKTNIDGRLAALQVEERLTRQEQITAEVVELAAGARSRRIKAAPA